MKLEDLRFGTELITRGFAPMQNGGVIMDVVSAEQAGIAEDAGAIAVMALERVPADIRAAGGVARMADPKKVTEIIDAVSIPVIASGGAGSLEHFYDALTEGGADAALAASLFHYKELEIREVKEYLRDRGLPVRL